MAQQISMTHGETGLRQAVPIGISWTTLFFGFFVPLIRGDIRWAAIMFVLAIVALVAGVFVIVPVAAASDAPGGILLLSLAGPLIINVVFAMRYNTICAAALVERGFKPTGTLGRRLLAAQGIGVRDPAPEDAGPGHSGQRERSDPGSVEDEDQTDPTAPVASKETDPRPLARPIVTAFGAIGAVAAIVFAIWAIGAIGTGLDEGSEPILGDVDPDDLGDVIEDAALVSPSDSVPGVLAPEDASLPAARTPEAVYDRETAAISSTAAPQPTIIGVDQLIEAFDENEFRALETYGNRPIQVTGVVQSVEDIDRLFSASIGAIVFESSHLLLTAVARVEDIASIVPLSPGDTAVVICRNAALEETAQLLGLIALESVGLDDCEVVANHVVVSAGSWVGDWFSHGSSVDDIAYERLSVTVMGTTGFLYSFECRSASVSRMSVDGIAAFDGFRDGVDASAGRTFAIRHADGQFWIETEARDYGEAVGGCVPPDLEPPNRFTRP